MLNPFQLHRLIAAERFVLNHTPTYRTIYAHRLTPSADVAAERMRGQAIDPKNYLWVGARHKIRERLFLQSYHLGVEATGPTPFKIKLSAGTVSPCLRQSKQKLIIYAGDTS